MHFDFSRYARHDTRELVKQLNCTQVGWGELLVSDAPMVSYGFASCRALVVQDGNRAGLVHIYGGENTQDIMKYMIGVLKELDEPFEKLGVALIYGAIPEQLHDACRTMGIDTTKTMPYPVWCQRDVIVIPEQREIIVVTTSETDSYKFPSPASFKRN